jgi:hypothetical protein
MPLWANNPWELLERYTVFWFKDILVSCKIYAIAYGCFFIALIYHWQFYISELTLPNTLGVAMQQISLFDDSLCYKASN